MGKLICISYYYALGRDDMKGQAAIMDALIFMLIAAGASTLLLFVSSLYASSSNVQIMAMYNYEYGGNALIALHYAKDDKGRWFWNEIKNLVEKYDSKGIDDYLNGHAEMVWKNVTYSSPAGDRTYLCFKSSSFSHCYPSDSEPEHINVHTSSVKITPQMDAIIKLFY